MQFLVSSTRLFHYPRTWKPAFGQKTKLGVDSSIMVSVSKDGHFQKHCIMEMGVAYHCSIPYNETIMPSLQYK